jgi:Tfp pilus assembly PilM family ATPase
MQWDLTWLRQNAQAPLAIDVGAAMLRAVQIERMNNRVQVRHWASQPRLPAPGTNGPAEPGDDLRAVLDRFDTREVALSLAPPEAEFCSLQVPAALASGDHGALLHGIRQEVARYVRCPIDTAELDAWRLPPGHRDGCNIMVAAAPRSIIEKQVNWLEQLNRTCCRVDVAPLAAMRACAQLVDDIACGKVWGVLDLGHRNTRLYIGIDETPIYVRCLAVSGQMMIERVASELHITIDAATRYVRHFGIAAAHGSYRPMAALTSGISEERMASILYGVLQPLLHSMRTETEKSFRYSMALYPDTPVGGLVLAGGGAALKGLEEEFVRQLGVPVTRLDTQRLTNAASSGSALTADVAGGLVTAIGACLGELAA